MADHPYDPEEFPEGEFINCRWCGKPKGLHKFGLPESVEAGHFVELTKDMNIQSIREHVQLVIDDAQESKKHISRAGMHVTVGDHLDYLYAEVQGLGKMMLEILNYLEMMGAK